MKEQNVCFTFCCYIQTLSLTILDILCHVVCTCVQSYYRRIQLLYCLHPPTSACTPPPPLIGALQICHHPRHLLTHSRQAHLHSILPCAMKCNLWISPFQHGFHVYSQTQYKHVREYFSGPNWGRFNFQHFQVLFVFSLVFFRKIAWQDWPASGVLPTTLSSHLPPSFLYYANLKHIAMHWIAAEKDLTIL